MVWHKAMKTELFNLNQRGNTLIQVMIATGIMLVIALGASSLIISQNREVQGVTDRLKITELQTQLSQTFANSTFCSCHFRGRTFDTTTNQWTPALDSIPSSYTAAPAFPSACTASTSPLIPSAGNLIPGSGAIQVSGIDVIDVTEIVAGSGNYSAKIRVRFDGTMRASRGAQASIVFNIDPAGGSATARPFLSCSGGGGGAATLTNCAWTAYSCAPSCPANKVAIGLRWNPPFNEDCGGG